MGNSCEATSERPLARNIINLWPQEGLHGFVSVEVNGDGRVITYIHEDPKRSVSLGDSVILAAGPEGHTDGPLPVGTRAIVTSMMFPHNMVPYNSDTTTHVFGVTGVFGKGVLFSQIVRPERIKEVIRAGFITTHERRDDIATSVRELIETQR